ncbi:MAG TPA: DUF6502 family protein [Nitrospiria bacterium]|jgi:hypothetical protein
MPQTLLSAAVTRLLGPLIRILLRYGIPFGTFADLAEKVYVDIAYKEFRLKGRAKSISRTSILTGLTRKEVKRIISLKDPEKIELTEEFNRAARVISGWIRDPQFLNPAHEPLGLPLEGRGPTLAKLIKLYSGDVPVRAVLDELIRVGAIEKLANKQFKLLCRAYIPQTDKEGKFKILGTDVKDLITTIDHNLQTPPGHTFFQRKVYYDNLPVEALKELRKKTNKRGQAFLEFFDRFLAQHDRDANPTIKGTQRKRAGIGIYYFEEDFNQKGKEDEARA